MCSVGCACTFIACSRVVGTHLSNQCSQYVLCVFVTFARFIHSKTRDRQWLLNTAWAPHSSCHVSTAADDGNALIWDLAPLPRPIVDPMLAFGAPAPINQLQWSSTQPDWLAIAFGNSGMKQKNKNTILINFKIKQNNKNKQTYNGAQNSEFLLLSNFNFNWID